MFDLSSLNDAKKKIENKTIKNKELLPLKLNEAIKSFDVGLNNKDSESLKKSLYLFVDVLEISKNKPEPYYYMSLIYHFFEEKKLSIDYFIILESLNPNFEGLLLLKDLLEI